VRSAPVRLGLALCLSCLTAVIGLQGRQRGTAGSPPAADAAVQFEDITQQAGLTFRHTNGASADKHIVETMSSGGLFFDYDNDGWLDVFLVDGGSLADPKVAATARDRLYRNRRDGTFEDVTAAARLTHQGFGVGACAGDFDNDGWTDLYLTRDGANALYKNNGNGSFTDVTQTAGVASTRMSTSCAFADVDKDGDLDLFVASIGPTALFRNRRADSGDSVFADATVPAGTYHNTIRSLEFTQLEPGVVDRKVYAPGIGIVVERALAGGQEVAKLVKVTG